MRKWNLLLLLVALFAAFSMPVAAQDDATTVIDKLEEEGTFTTLLAAIDAAGLRETLEGEGPFTVFAPTDDAFTAALEAMGMTAEDLLADTEALTAVLTYHVLPERLTFRRIVSTQSATTVQGEDITLAEGDAALWLINGVSSITAIDRVADNGVVHIIDTVLMPPSMMETAAPEAEATEEAVATEAPVAAEPTTIIDKLEEEGTFTTLLAAIDAAGLREILENEGPHTLFAPTDDAIAASLEAMGMTAEDLLADTDTLAQILTYHVLPEKLTFRRIVSTQSATTVQGEDITLAEGDSALWVINGTASITAIDRVADNGVVHIIDAVLVPPSILEAMAPAATEVPTEEAVATEAPVAAEPTTIIDRLEAEGVFTTLLAAIDAAGLRETLDGEGQYTLFAPTDDAIAAALESMGMSAEDLLADTGTLTQILTYHVLPEKLTFRRIVSTQSATTIQGEDITLAEGDAALWLINGTSSIIAIDRVADNGVVHIIDTVLVPPSLAASMVPAATETPAEPETASGVAHVRVAHFAPDAPAVDVFVEGELGDVQGLAFGVVSPWMELPAGTYDFAVSASGTSFEDAVIGPVDVTLNDGDWITVAAVGSMANESLMAAVIVEDMTGLDPANARIVLFHAIEGAPAVDVVANGVVVVQNLAYPGAQGDNDGAYDLDVLGGVYDIQVLATGTSTVLLDLPDTPIDAGMYYLIAAVGTPDVPSISVTANEEMATP